MHEVFLQRLAAHSVFRNDNNFRIFLEYKEDVDMNFELLFFDKKFVLVKCSR